MVTLLKFHFPRPDKSKVKSIPLASDHIRHLHILRKNILPSPKRLPPAIQNSNFTPWRTSAINSDPGKRPQSLTLEDLRHENSNSSSRSAQAIRPPRPPCRAPHERALARPQSRRRVSRHRERQPSRTLLHRRRISQTPLPAAPQTAHQVAHAPRRPASVPNATQGSARSALQPPHLLRTHEPPKIFYPREP